jgi:hypothetical protein
MNCTDTCDRRKELDAVVDSPRALSITDFWNDAIEVAAQAAEEVARKEIEHATGRFLISLGADKSAAAIRKLKR